MPLSPAAAVEQAKYAHEIHEAERPVLDEVRLYWKGRQRLPAVIPAGTPGEVRVMQRSSRTNFMERVIGAMTQKVFVDGFRARQEADDSDVWNIWQANRLDARQSAIHSAAFAYGTSYAVVLPGDPVPVIRPASPRSLTAIYGEDPDWPMFALERLGRGLWLLLDEDGAYYLQQNETDAWTFLETRIHDTGHTPVVRYLNDFDLDDEDEPNAGMPVAVGERPTPTRGEVAPLMRLQDQFDLATFGLQVAQHYGAFRQRWIVGWVAETEREAIKAAASQVWTFDEDPQNVQLGEFDQTNLDGYLKSRESTLRHIAIVSQTPLHELMPDLANPTSAEALAAQESGHERKLEARQTLLGESHEQALRLAGKLAGIEVPNDAQVRWRDTSARAFSATVDAWGKAVTMLGVPPQAVWEKLPGVTKQDLDQWKADAATGDAFANLTAALERQANGNGATPPAPVR